MRWWLFTLNLVLCGTVRAGQPDDPLRSPECRAALAALEAREDAASTRAGASRPDVVPQRRLGEQWEAARRAAAHACLRASPETPAPRRADHPPVLIAPTPKAAAAPPPAPPPAVPVTLPPLQMPMPKTVTSCDLSGCWISDGTRLPRAGSGLLIGPKGFCSVQGVTLFCP